MVLHELRQGIFKPANMQLYGVMDFGSNTIAGELATLAGLPVFRKSVERVKTVDGFLHGFSNAVDGIAVVHAKFQEKTVDACPLHAVSQHVVAINRPGYVAEMIDNILCGLSGCNVVHFLFYVVWPVTPVTQTTFRAKVVYLPQLLLHPPVSEQVCQWDCKDI